MKPKMDDARANGWKKHPSVYLPEVVSNPASIEAIFEAITALTDSPSPAADPSTGQRS